MSSKNYNMYVWEYYKDFIIYINKKLSIYCNNIIRHGIFDREFKNHTTLAYRLFREVVCNDDVLVLSYIIKKYGIEHMSMWIINIVRHAINNDSRSILQYLYDHRSEISSNTNDIISMNSGIIFISEASMRKVVKN